LNTLLPLLVSWLQQYGYLALGLSIFVAAIGLPVPVSLMLLAAGAFAGLGDFNIVLLGLIALITATGGDNLSYLIGRQFGSKVLNWLAQQPRLYVISPQVIPRSRTYFQKQGGWAIFLSRFLITALGGTINLLAGAELYPYRRFLGFDIAGNILGAIIPLTLGYIFGASWEAIGDMLGDISGFLTALLIFLYLLISLIKMARNMRAAKMQHMYQDVQPKPSFVEMQQKPDSLPL
jgi:membrane-associated protein